MQVLASIDLGSDTIKLVVAEIKGDDCNILCAISEESRGIEGGVIVEPDDTIYAIKRLLKREEELLGFSLSKVIVTVPEDEADFKIGEASVIVDAPDKEISASDIVHVLQASTKGKIDNHYDLVTVIPIMFKVDDSKTRLPKGLKGNSLSVKSVVVSAPKKEIYLVAKCMEKCGLEVIDIMLPSIGAYYSHKNETTDIETGALIDCGGETISVSIFNKGIIINNLVLKAGGKQLDTDISYVYKLTYEQSKDLKENFSLAFPKNASEKDKESIVNLEGEKVIINQNELTEVVSSRLQQMLKSAKNEINYLTKKEISFIIITGGLTELRDFSYLAESVFGRIASIGKIKIVGARDNKYASSVGMIKYFDYKLKLRDQVFSVLSSEDEEILIVESIKKTPNSDSIMNKIFGIFFDN